MYNYNYIGYRKSVGDLLSSGAATAATSAKVYASGGTDIAADIALVASVSNLFNDITAHPAADARDFIKNHKPIIAKLDPYNRLKSVITYSQQINPRAIDVDAAEWILWYKTTYLEDYKTLPPNAKVFWNNYLNTVKQTYNNPNNMNKNLDLAMFSQYEINYNATPVETASNILTSATSGTTNWVLYGALAIGAILLIKNLK
jgi:hypothetical protein